jgi:ABC-type dipeptide/oligopeptide/nickel transport system permease component
VPVVIGVSVVVFSIVHLLPGDPVLAILSGANATPEQERELRAQLRLDDPLPAQYVRFISRAVVGDFGRSIFTRRPVIQEIAEQLPSTLELAATAIVIAVMVGLALGLVAACGTTPGSTARRCWSRSGACRCRASGSACC